MWKLWYSESFIPQGDCGAWVTERVIPRSSYADAVQLVVLEVQTSNYHYEKIHYLRHWIFPEQDKGH